MKRAILIISLFILIGDSYCQNQFGVKVGYNLFKIVQSSNSDQPSNFNYDRNSIPVAIFFCKRNHLINLNFEIEFFNRSYSVQEYWGGLGSGGQANYKINSFNVNAVIAPQFVFGRKIKVIVFPGIYVGTPLYSKIDGKLSEFALGQSSRQETLTGNAKRCIPSIDFGALAGIGIDIPVSKNLIITFQDVFNITLIPFDSRWGDNSYRYMQNKFEVGLAYQFNCKKKKDGEDSL